MSERPPVIGVLVATILVAGASAVVACSGTAKGNGTSGGTSGSINSTSGSTGTSGSSGPQSCGIFSTGTTPCASCAVAQCCSSGRACSSDATCSRCVNQDNATSDSSCTGNSAFLGISGCIYGPCASSCSGTSGGTSGTSGTSGGPTSTCTARGGKSEAQLSCANFCSTGTDCPLGFKTCNSGSGYCQAPDLVDCYKCAF